MLTVHPARVLGLGRGRLEPGSDADVTIIDPGCSWRADTSVFHSHSRNCPYDGWLLTDRATHTIVGGALRYSLETPAPRVDEERCRVYRTAVNRSSCTRGVR